MILCTLSLVIPVCLVVLSVQFSALQLYIYISQFFLL
ncbi:hypothetical protein NC651_035053 [Populus alba x Populus x berolinensis]|nr:hypothetical protein NC651_035053 [Populus alba x Populus x berolinensis]